MSTVERRRTRASQVMALSALARRDSMPRCGAGAEESTSGWGEEWVCRAVLGKAGQRAGVWESSLGEEAEIDKRESAVPINQKTQWSGQGRGSRYLYQEKGPCTMTYFIIRTSMSLL